MKQLIFLMAFCFTVMVANAQVLPIIPKGSSFKYNQQMTRGNVSVFFPAKIGYGAPASLLNYFVNYFKAQNNYKEDNEPDTDGKKSFYSIRLDVKDGIYKVGVILIKNNDKELSATSKIIWGNIAKEISTQCFGGAEVQLFAGNGDFTTNKKWMVSSKE